MAFIRAKYSFRIIFLVLVVSLMGLSVMIMRTEHAKDWKTYQAQYQPRYKRILEGKIKQAEQQGDKAAQEKWKRLLLESAHSNTFTINQVFLPDAGVRDLCQTCHVAMENPLFFDAPNPLRAHPADILHDHKPNRFGCTLCHHGQGVGLSTKKAHGQEENWPLPRVPKRFVQGLCLGCHETAFGLKGAEKAQYGRQVFIAKGCYGCHEARTLEDLPYMSPPFQGIGTKIYDNAWLFQWIKEPSGIRPKTLMPTYRLKDEEILHLVSFLDLQKKLPKALASYDRDRASPRTGETLFTEKGCIGCHSNQWKEPCLTDRVPNLADSGLKMDRRWILTWLEEPRALNPDTAMPQIMLTFKERRDLTEYVKSLWAKSVDKRLKASAKTQWGKGRPEEGKRLVQVMGCYGCHRVEGMDQLPLPGVQVAEVASKRLDELPFGNSQVPHTKWDWLYHKIKQPATYETIDMPLKMPDYRLDAKDVESLTTFYLHNDYYPLPKHYHFKSSKDTQVLSRGEWMLSHFNCTGCHQIEKDTKPRINRYLALKSMVPPRLVDEGERVQPQWVFQFLSNPVNLRPWLKIRMPTFNWTYADRKDLIEYFALLLDAEAQKRASVPYVLLPIRENYDPEIVDMGEYRVKTDKCMQCHPVSMDGELPEGVKLEDLSINLMLSKSRLRFEWIKNFLRNPDAYAGQGTKMPFVYYTPDRVPRIPDPEKWIQYTALYLMFMDKVPEMPKEEKIEEIRPGAEIDWTQYE